MQPEARHGGDEVGSSVRLMVRDVDVKIPHNNDSIVVACIKRCNRFFKVAQVGVESWWAVNDTQKEHLGLQY